MAGLELHNTRTRQVEPFAPLDERHVRMYTCGPTVYAPQHIGNLRSQLFADLLKRTLLFAGYRVTHVINITDVGHLTDDADSGEDKVEAAARRTGRRAEDITRQYTDQWRRDRARVNCLEPEVLCRASEHVPEQVEMIRQLEAQGVVYRIDDGLYFDVSRFPRYAEFARLDLDQAAGESRIGEVAGKRHPADFALWKFAPAGVKRQQEWDSPWGRGFPGWHIECSAMSVKYLGTTFDIHTGGVDHIKVHHTNEIAQSEAALGVHPWVRVWMHHEFLTFEREKMAKSAGNILVLDDLIARGISPLGYRYFFLQAHYRQRQSVKDEALEAAERGYRRLHNQAQPARQAEGPADPGRMAPWLTRFSAALEDDLNAPRALALAWEATRAEDLGPAERRALLTEFDRVLGLDLLAAELVAAPAERDPRIDALLGQREDARRRRDWAEADRIRAALRTEGIVIEDSPQGPRWRRA